MGKILQSIESKIKKCEESKYSKSELEKTVIDIFQMAVNLYGFELYDESLACFLRCLDIERKLSNEQDNCNTLDILKWMGCCFISLGKYDEAINHYNELLPICIKVNPETKWGVLNGVARCLFQQDKFDEALNLFKESYELTKDDGSLKETDRATVLYNIGRVYEKNEMYVEALDNFNKSLEIYQRFSPLDHKQLRLLFYYIGEMHYKLEDCEKALSYLKRALDEYGKSEVDSLIEKIRNKIGLTYKKLGNFEEALKYLNGEKNKKDCESEMENKHESFESQPKMENEEKVEMKVNEKKNEIKVNEEKMEEKENEEKVLMKGNEEKIEDDGFLLVDAINEIHID